MAVTTESQPQKQATGLSAELGKRFRDNIQTYTIILALIAIWILFAVLVILPGIIAFRIAREKKNRG